MTPADRERITLPAPPPDDAEQWTAVENAFDGMPARPGVHLSTTFRSDRGECVCFDCGETVRRG
jgi:hypothetical protein